MEGRLEETSPARGSSLPEDDGMEALRQKMREIHNLAISTEEKARKMHLLMTRDYNAMHNKVPLPSTEEEVPEELRRTTTADNPYNIHPDDLVPTYCPDPVVDCDEEDNPTEEAHFPLGCQHYSRNVKVQCYDCKLWFSCRHCHDTSDHLPFPHQLNRKKTQNMLCMHCKTPQPAAETCMNCNEDTAYYYCPKCKLWDNDSTKRIYHCDDCGICRRGEGLGKDYVHCKRCNVCISISTSAAHPCIERATDCDCPLCLDYLFSSPQPVVSLLCGHYMHATCYKDLMRVTYRCPVCNKSAVNMELQWRKLDDEIRLQPMPEEDFEPLTPRSSRPSSAIGPDVLPDSTLAAETHPAHPPSDQLEPTPQPITRRHVPRRVWIGCNDCGGRGYTPFHWLGLRCSVCDGYNTTQVTPLGNSSLSTPLIRPVSATYSRQRQHDFTGVDAIRSFGDGSGEGAAAGLGVDILTDEERADSAYESGDRGLGHWPAHLGRGEEGEWVANADLASGRSYFFRAEMEENAAAAANPAHASGISLSPGALGSLGEGLRERAGLLRPDRALSASASEMFGGVPYEMVMRLGRSLSPMRYYIDGLDLNAPPGSENVESGALVHGGGKENGHAAGLHDDQIPDVGERSKTSGAASKGTNDRFWSSDGRFLGVWQSSDDDVEDGDDDDDDGEEDEDEDDDGDSEDSADEDEDDEGDVVDDDDDDDDDDDHLLPGHM